MTLTPPKMPKKDWIITPEGSHQAVCYAVWDLGFQRTTWEGKEKILPKIRVAFEVNELIPEGEYQGKRYTISKEYTFSLGEKANLAKDLESWLSKEISDEERETFDVSVLVGRNCILSVVHKESKGNTYANIKSISPLMKGMAPITPENKPDEPDWIKKIQAKAVPPEEVFAPEVHEAPEKKDDEEVPF